MLCRVECVSEVSMLYGIRCLSEGSMVYGIECILEQYVEWDRVFILRRYSILFLRINVTEKNCCHMGNRTHDLGTNHLAIWDRVLI